MRGQASHGGLPPAVVSGKDATVARLLSRVTDPHLFVDASTLDIFDESETEFDPDYTGNGLVDVLVSGGSAKVLCGQEIGYLAVTAELWDGPPPLDATPWQDIAEVSAHWPSAVMLIGEEAIAPEDAPSLLLPGPGDYRVRVSGKNRDDGDPRAENDPTEEYLLQVWQAAPAEPFTHKATSDHGAYHRSAG